MKSKVLFKTFSLFIILTFFILSGVSIIEDVEAAPKLGDVSNDGRISSTDYTLMRRYVLGSINDFPGVDDLSVADLNGDNSIGSIDYTLLGSYLLGQIDEFPAANNEIEQKVQELLSQMTLEEKVGQMIQAERRSAAPSDVQNYYLGSILSGGGSSPGNKDSWYQMTQQYQQAAMSTRLGIPIIYGVDAVHGHNTVYGAVIFPHNIGLGAANDPELMRRIGNITAAEMITTGVNWNFGPCVAVARDERWGRTYESYSEAPEIVSNLSAPYIEGLQEYDIAATAKHFIADGGTSWGTGDHGYPMDQGNAIISEDELREIHLPPYKAAIEAGVKTVMISFSSWNGVKCHQHKYLITDLLKGELGFEGFVISDWEGIHQIDEPSFYDQVVAAVNAGIDMLMEPTSWQEVYEIIITAVNNGDISEARINDAVSRILRVKFEINLFENPTGNQEYVENSFGSTAHREVAREAVRKSLVLLKNEGNILPLSKNANIYVAGSNADNLGNQCGGWTISWQGMSGNITEGTTIKEGIAQAIAGQGSVVSDINQADVAIVVVGETPYAEGMGDDNDLSLSYEDIRTIEQVKAAGKPVVVILVSGRPMIVTNEIGNWDAFVAAWLPGTEGQGVADVLFGDYDFSGKLSFTWPRSMSQIPINVDNMGNEDPLFPYGYGLKMYE